jgi:hypothetical protein
MRAAIGVNGPVRKSPVSQKHLNARPKTTEHVDAVASTLARESRHIVASASSDTTSRAVVLTLKTPVFCVNVQARFLRPAKAKGFCRKGFLRRFASQRCPQQAGATRRKECDDGIDLV